MTNDALKKLVGDLSRSGHRPERHGITVYLPKEVFDRIEKHREGFELSRQEFVSSLINVGLEAFEAEYKKRKAGNRKE